ncbi:DUF58 domain-containing protein [Methylacidiphilum kamchatkense]|uniref:DUF58 domain-containing protein n=1 Tax=Methylacidiphilum kamchatkense TaxID=431057 RepID=UPI000689B6F7|nr:DUF58 domain-containing protein [Methylacidiphilum kamchatkense]
MAKKEAEPFVFSKEKVKEALRLLRRIEWTIKTTSTYLFSGEYRSVFKGKGKEFDQVVAYEFGDDFRDIDWNVTARLGALYRKKYIEERELVIVIVIEDSPSLLFGSGAMTKRQTVMEIAAILAILATGFRHRLGIVHVFPGDYLFIPPAKGRKKVFSNMVKICSLAPPSLLLEQPVEIPWAFLQRVLPRNTILFWIGDFPLRPIPQQWFALSQRFEILGFRVEDPWEQALPMKESFLAFDPVTGKVVKIDPSKPETKKRQQQWRLERDKCWNSLFPNRSSRCSFTVGKSIFADLLHFFAERSTIK